MPGYVPDLERAQVRRHVPDVGGEALRTILGTDHQQNQKEPRSAPCSARSSILSRAGDCRSGTPLLGFYDSSSTDALDHQIRWMRYPGIDFALWQWIPGCGRPGRSRLGWPKRSSRASGRPVRSATAGASRLKTQRAQLQHQLQEREGNCQRLAVQLKDLQAREERRQRETCPKCGCPGTATSGAMTSSWARTWNVRSRKLTVSLSSQEAPQAQLRGTFSDWFVSGDHTPKRLAKGFAPVGSPFSARS